MASSAFDLWSRWRKLSISIKTRLLAVDHPDDVDVYPNEYFASNPPYPEFKVW